MARLKYYDWENRRWPSLRRKGASVAEVREFVRLWCAENNMPEPVLIFRDSDTGGKYRPIGNTITLGVPFLNWLLVAHELAHMAHFKGGRRPGERSHGKAHAAHVDAIAARLMESFGMAAKPRAAAVARTPSLEERIAHREDQIARLTRKIKALETRRKTARRSLAALKRSLARKETLTGS